MKGMMKTAPTHNKTNLIIKLIIKKQKNKNKIQKKVY